MDERLGRTALHSVKAPTLPSAQAKRNVLGLYCHSLGTSPSLWLLPTFLSFRLFSPLLLDGYGYLTDSDLIFDVFVHLTSFSTL